MNRAIGKRYLAVLGGVLAVAAATAVSLAIEPNQQSGYGVPTHPTSVPSTSTGPGQVASTHRPTPHRSTVETPDTPETPAVARTSPTGLTATTGTPAPAVTSPEEPDDLLKRQDPLPDGVPEQVEFFLGGGTKDCSPEKPPEHPQIEGAAPVIEIPTELMLCFVGFNHSNPLTVTVTPPSGSAATTVLLPAGDYFLAKFRWLPGDPVGEYLITAEQEKLDAAVKFTLRHASSPRIWLARPPPEWPVAGTDIDLYLGGFPANRPTLLHLYDYHTARYRTSFTVPVGAIGEARVAIDTKLDDPPGCYGIISDLAYKPGDIAESVFCIK